MAEIANSKYLEQSTGSSLWQTASLNVLCYYQYYIIIIIDNWWSLSKKKFAIETRIAMLSAGSEWQAATRIFAPLQEM